MSIVEPTPWYQSSLQVPASSPNGRMVPDLALDSSGTPGTYIISRERTAIGGTSESSPLFAGLFTLIMGPGEGEPGSLQPGTIPDGRESQTYQTVIHPVNFGYTIPWVSSFGYNIATGWGAPNIGEMARVYSSLGSSSQSLGVEVGIVNPGKENFTDYSPGDKISVTAEITGPTRPPGRYRFLQCQPRDARRQRDRGAPHLHLGGEGLERDDRGRERIRDRQCQRGRRQRRPQRLGLHNDVRRVPGCLCAADLPLSLDVPSRPRGRRVHLGPLREPPVVPVRADSVQHLLHPEQQVRRGGRRHPRLHLLDGILLRDTRGEPHRRADDPRHEGPAVGYLPFVSGISLMGTAIYPQVVAEPGSVAPGQSLTIIASVTGPENIDLTTSLATGRPSAVP